MDVVLGIVLPVFGLIGVGYGAGRARVLTGAALQGLTSYTFVIAFSALLFRAMRNVRFETLEPHILVDYFAGSLLTFVIAALLGRFVFRLRLAEQAFMALCGCFSNGVGLGIPLVLQAYGEAGLTPFLMITALHSLVLLTLAALMIELDRPDSHIGARLWASFLAMIRHPVLLAIAAGMAWGALANATGWRLPDFIEQMLKLLSDSAAPCSLVGLGASLAAIRLAGDLGQTVAMTVLKLLVAPALVFLATHVIFSLPPLWVAVATLYAALPTGANVYLFAQRYGIYVARSTSVVLVSTAFSIVTLTALLAIFA
jgi:predicted permease